MDFIIAPLEVYIGKMLIFNRECLTCICVSYKCCQKYVWGIGLMASSSESRHVVLFQSRVQEGAQKGG